MAEPENKGENAPAAAPAKPAAAAASATDQQLTKAQADQKAAEAATKAAKTEADKQSSIKIAEAKTRLANAKTAKEVARAALLKDPNDAKAKADLAAAEGQEANATQELKAEGSSGNFFENMDIGKLLSSVGIGGLVFFLVQSVTGGGTIGMLLAAALAVAVGASGMGSGFGKTINGWLGRDQKPATPTPGQQQALGAAQVPGTEIGRVSGEEIALAAQQFHAKANDKVRFVKHADGKSGVEIVAADAADANGLQSFSQIAQSLNTCAKSSTLGSCGVVLTTDPKNPQAGAMANFVPMAPQTNRTAQAR